MISYHVFDKLQQILPAHELPEHGICMGMANFFFDRKIEDMPGELEKMLEIASSKVSFIHLILAVTLTHLKYRLKDLRVTPRWSLGMRSTKKQA